MQYLSAALRKLMNGFHELVDDFGLYHGIHDRLLFDHIFVKLIDVFTFYFFTADVFEAIVSDGNEEVAFACIFIIG